MFDEYDIFESFLEEYQWLGRLLFNVMSWIMLAYIIVTFTHLFISKNYRKFIQIHYIILPLLGSLWFFTILFWYWHLVAMIPIGVLAYFIFKWLKRNIEAFESQGINGPARAYKKQKETFEKLTEEEKEKVRQRVKDNPIKLLHPAICFLIWLGVPFVLGGILTIVGVYKWLP